MSDGEKSLLIYDGDCALCRRSIARWRARTGDRIEYLPLQQPGLLRRLGVPLSAALRSVQLVTPRGERYQGADAVFRTLGHAPGLRIATRLSRLPIARWIAEWIYRRVAAHRELAGRVETTLFGRSTTTPGTALARSLFMRGLGAVYLIAFSSLRSQVLGLYGRHGIRPIHEYIDAMRDVTRARIRYGQHLALERARLVPSLFWLDASDLTLVRACIAGQVAAVLLMLGFAPRLTAKALWALYLSFVSTGREFLSFQWDALLLETGLAATIVAPPMRRRGRALEAPPWTAVALMRWLVFRLYFESGLCKLASHDPTWRKGTACTYHYGTQPLPTRLGWYAHQLPRGVHRFSTYAAVGLELCAPFLMFMPRRVRRVGWTALAGLQTLIAATGNYGFFNLLTLVDSLWMLDDEPIARTLRLRPPPVKRAPWWRRIGVAIAALPVLALSIGRFVAKVRDRTVLPRALLRLQDAAAPFESVNPYGLFAVMTTERPEIIVEGSHDGELWREYRFRYKPDDVRKPPRLAAPHQPRLDWQMWFAALGAPPPWFGTFLARLLENEHDVLALLDGNPFPDRPPTYIRALLYDYRMTSLEERRRTGAWWHRELRGMYFPPVKLGSRRREH